MPRSSWQSVIFEQPADLVVINPAGGKFDVGIRSAENGQTTPAGSYASMTEAMRIGGSLISSAENHADADVLESMDLSAEDWEVEYGQDGIPAAFSEDRRYMISWASDSVSDGGHPTSGHWILFDNSEEVATSEMPGDLMQERRASHP
jgi:hypothetical protein